MSLFALIPILFVLGNVYILRRLWTLVPDTAHGLRIAVLVVGLLLTAAFFVGMAARSWNIPVWAVAVLYRVGSAWIFIFFYLTIVFLVGDLLRLVHLVPRGVMFGNWLTLGILAGFLVVVFTAGNIIYHKKRRVEITLEADVARPVTIVAASDLHLGFGIGRGELARWVDMINGEHPDAVVFAGDVIDTSTRPLWQGDYAAEFRRLDAPYGVFAVPGNHEYISGIEESMRFLEHAGMTVLRDSVAMIADGVAIVGRDDAANRGRKTLAEIMEGLAEAGRGSGQGLDCRDGGLDRAQGQEVSGRDFATLLLDHQPLHLGDAADAGVDLQISGHTHRGQVWPATWITDAMFELSHGEMRKGGTRYLVTSGLGIWGGKFRLGSRSEYIVINICPTTK